LQPQEINKVLPDLMARLKYPDMIVMPNLNQQLKKHGKIIINHSLYNLMNELQIPDVRCFLIMSDLMGFLLKHNYKLNFRELKNILHHAIMNREDDPEDIHVKFLSLSSLSSIRNVLEYNEIETVTANDINFKYPIKEMKLSDVLSESDSLEPLFIENNSVTMMLDYQNIKFAEIHTLIEKIGRLLAKGMIMYTYRAGVDFKNAFTDSKSNVRYEGYMQKIKRIIGMTVSSYLKEKQKDHSIIDDHDQLLEIDSDGISKISDKTDDDHFSNDSDLPDHHSNEGADNNLEVVNETNELLQSAVVNKNVNMMKTLMDNGADINSKIFHDCTVLHIAVFKDDLDMVKHLIDNGADINAKAEDDFTALHLAVSIGNAEIVRELIANKSDINAKIKDGSTALYFAVNKGHLDIVSQLLRKGAEIVYQSDIDLTKSDLEDGWVNPYLFGFFIDKRIDLKVKLKCKQSVLHLAVVNGFVEIVDMMISSGVDINTKESVLIDELLIDESIGHEDLIKNMILSGKSGLTALHVATIASQVEVIKMLIAKGCDVTAKNDDHLTAFHFAAIKGNEEIVRLLAKHSVLKAKAKGGSTALHLAALQGHAEVVSYLIEIGAEVNDKAVDGFTPLHYAVLLGHTEVVDRLITKEADVNAKTNDNFTALHIAAEHGRTEIASRLIDKETDVNAKSKDNITALYLAVLKGNIEIVKLLISKKAHVKAKAQNDYTALHVAAANGHIDIIDILIDKGADVNAKLSDGTTALFLSVLQGNENMVRHLLNNKADVNAKTAAGITPLIIATSNGYPVIVDLLISNGAETDVVTNDGHAALDFALLRGDENMFNILQSKGAKSIKFNFINYIHKDIGVF